MICCNQYQCMYFFISNIPSKVDRHSEFELSLVQQFQFTYKRIEIKYAILLFFSMVC